MHTLSLPTYATSSRKKHKKPESQWNPYDIVAIAFIVGSVIGWAFSVLFVINFY